MSGKQPETVQEEFLPPYLHSSSSRQNSSNSSKAPPVHPVRTPARTKRRSVSSTLSDPASPTADKTPTPLPYPSSRDLDFASLLSTPTPIIFSTPVERELLNTLSILGFDTAQIVHSVLSDACDAAGAVWWMLKKKAEKRQIDGNDQDVVSPAILPSTSNEQSKRKSGETKLKKRRVNVGAQTEPTGFSLTPARSAPQLAFVPATPTYARSTTPPRPVTPTRSSMLSPSSSTVAGDTSSKSHPSTPASSFKDREGKGRKARSGSVSIMQRATTALEAAGLVRKKSSEAVREEKDRDRERSRDMERKLTSGEESRSSYTSGSSRLTKSPPLKPSKEYPPSTPPPSETHNPQPTITDSPWVMTEAHDSLSRHHGARVLAPTPANTPGEVQLSMSAPDFSETSNRKISGSAPHRNRANLLTTFRLWFNEDRKGKRKENAGGGGGANAHTTYSRPLSSSGQPFSGNTGKRRGSTSSAGKFSSRTAGHRARASISSRRSSSVNSRRSSGTSVQMHVMDSPQIPTRRSFGSHTPNSERGDYSSRPSSVRSFSMQPRHRKSPSASSAGSAHFRTASPMQKYHRRAGSTSSTTRVVRQIQTTPRPTHMRSNSTTSSLHSPTSSRPTSFYDVSENEGPRTTSPYKTRTRRSIDDAPRRPPNNGSTTFVAQKRQGPFMSPVTHANSLGRSSWKKSWGLEPPGWQSRTTHLPIEVLSISPATEPTSIRDVFSGRQSLSLGDESDWVDEEDDIPAFAGGLGQMGTSMAPPGGILHSTDPPVMLLPAPRGHRSTKRANRSSPTSSSTSAGSSRQKSSHSPIERASPVPSDNIYDSAENRGGRRQLPVGRSGPAFRHAIQEEDEGEEE